MSFLPDLTSSDSAQNSRFRVAETENENESPQLKERSKKHKFTKEDTARFRNSLKHNICVDMLREGYHKSFSEFSAVIQEWQACRQAASPGSALWLQKPLEEQQSKMYQLQYLLTSAEAAQRAGLYEEVYEKHIALARYFENQEDKWLSHYFYRVGLQSAARVKLDGGKREAEANSYMGHICMDQGQLETALGYYEAFHHLTMGQAWRDEAGRTLYSQACECLWRIYTLLAGKLLESKEHRSAIKTLAKAFEMAKEAGDKKIEGEAAYRIGVAYQCVGEQETARGFLNMYMEISTALGDDESLGKAYKAIAKSLESEGKIDETIENLNKFAEMSEGDNKLHNLEDACVRLGVIFTSRGQYDRGCEYFRQAYEMASGLNDVSLVQKAQVHLSNAEALRMMTAYSSHVQAAGYAHMQKLLAWKESRDDTFNHADKKDENI